MANLRPGKYRGMPLGVTHAASGLPIYAGRCGDEIHQAPNNKQIGTRVGTHESSGYPIYAGHPCKTFVPEHHLAGALGVQHAGYPVMFEGCNECERCDCEFIVTGNYYLHFPRTFQSVEGGCPHMAYLPLHMPFQSNPIFGGGFPRELSLDWALPPGDAFGFRSVQHCPQLGYSPFFFRLERVNNRWQASLRRLRTSFPFDGVELARYEAPTSESCELELTFQEGIVAPERATVERACVPCGIGFPAPNAIGTIERLSGTCDVLHGRSVAISPALNREPSWPAWHGVHFLSFDPQERIVLVLFLRCAGTTQTANDLYPSLTYGLMDNAPFFSLGTITPWAMARLPVELVFSSQTPPMLIYEFNMDQRDPRGCSGRLRLTITA